MVHVQAILFASLAASLFSAFLAMLGKQWLNRYDSADMRGTAIERSQNRQGKLDGFVVWYFDNVMESLPLMLQAALLLFGCALSRSLWEVNITIASVVVGLTSFGVLCYLFIIIAGTASESCPYQTPGAQILRHYIPLLRHSLPVLRFTFSKFSRFIKTSHCRRSFIVWREGLEQPWYSMGNSVKHLSLLLRLIVALVIDTYHLGQAILRLLVAPGRTAYHKFMVTFLRTRDLDQQSIILDLRCVSWMLQTSLNKVFYLTALKYLAEIPELTYFEPSLVTGCFNVFISCINVVDNTLVMTQGLEQLATLSASYFLRTFCHSFATDPTSSTLADLRRRYNRVFSSGQVEFRDPPFDYSMIAAHILFSQHYKPPKGWRRWVDNRPSTQEHIQLAWCIAEAAQVGYRRTRHKKVPRWTLHFAFDSLSLDPPSPPSVVADCLKIIAVELDCNIPTLTISDRRCVQIL